MIEILIVLVVIGVVLWLVETQIPMAQPIKVIIRVIVILGLCIWLLNVFGVTHFAGPSLR